MLLLITIYLLLPCQFLLLFHMQIHYCSIHPLRVFRNPIVHIHLRTIYLLPTICFIIQSHGSSHTSLLILALTSLSNQLFLTFFLFLQYHTQSIIFCQPTLSFMLLLCRQKRGGQRQKTTKNQLITRMSMMTYMYWIILARQLIVHLCGNLVLALALSFGTNLPSLPRCPKI